MKARYAQSRRGPEEISTESEVPFWPEPLTLHLGKIGNAVLLSLPSSTSPFFPEAKPKPKSPKGLCV